jgi:hypothetical protein
MDPIVDEKEEALLGKQSSLSYETQEEFKMA